MTDEARRLTPIEHVTLPAPKDYEPSPEHKTQVDSKVAYQLLEYLHKRQEKYPKCPRIERYIKQLKVDYNRWYPPIGHCGCFN